MTGEREQPEDFRRDEEHKPFPCAFALPQAARLVARRAVAYPEPSFRGSSMKFNRDVVGAIGRTPLIRLRAASEATGCTILGKAEFMNPGGSVKDRAALAIIRDAVERGALRPGGVVVEGTAGNTGIGIAMVAARARLPRHHRHPRHPDPGKEGHAAACRRGTDRGAGGPLFQPQQLRPLLGAPRRGAGEDRSRTARSGPTSSTMSPTATAITRRRGRRSSTTSTAASTASSARSAPAARWPASAWR